MANVCSVFLNTPFMMLLMLLPVSAAAFEQDQAERPLFAIAKSLDSPGFAEMDLTPSLIRQLQDSEAAALRGKLPPASAPERVIADSMLLMVEDKKLAVIQLSVGDRIREVAVMGFRDGVFYRVGCVRESGHDISLFFGRCGKMVSETFGFNP